MDPRDAVLIAEFTLISIGFYLPAILAGGLDARIYRLAALQWMAGGSPLDAHLGAMSYAAPPLTLLVVAPFAQLPEPVFVALNMTVGIASAVFVLRRLELPAWWLLFPPVFEGVMVGNLNLLVLALLLAGRWWTDLLAAVAKVYALLPMLVLGRWRSVIVTAAFVVVSWPFLPWADYISKAGAVTDVLIAQSHGGHSAFADPWLIPVAAVGLLILGRKRAAWLSVPALWPATQVHYAVFALPAASRLLAAIIALPIPVAPVIAVVVEASRTLLDRRREAIATDVRQLPVRTAP